MRTLDVYTLENAAKHYAEQFTMESVKGLLSDKFIGGYGYVLQNMFDLTFKDEYERVLAALTDQLSQDDLTKFKRNFRGYHYPRSDDVLEELLLERLALNPLGEHVHGFVGKTQVGNRRVGSTIVESELRRKPTGVKKFLGMKGELIEKVFRVKPEYWPVYAGELTERAAGSDAVDELPKGAEPYTEMVLALNPRIANVAAIAAADAIVDLIDGGTSAGNIRGRTGAQPAGADETETGTLLFTLVMSDPAFGNAADGTPGGVATASAITDDSSADATGTLGYCRVAAVGTSPDDIMDGEAGTSGADFNFSTLSIVSGATISMSSFTVTMPES